MGSVSEGKEKEESVVEGLRQSLLEVVEEKCKSMNKKFLLHRMVIISKLAQRDLQDVGLYYDQLLKDIQNKHQNEGATGLLLIYQRYTAHFIEGSIELLYEVCKDHAQLSGDKILTSRVLIVSHDVPQRLYLHWWFRVLDIEAPRMEEYEMNEPPETVVAEVLIQMLKLAAYLSRQPKIALKTAMDYLHDKVPELLPQQSVLGFLLEKDAPSCVSLPSDYVAMYEEPYDVVLESEMTWPMPVKFIPYN